MKSKVMAALSGGVDSAVAAFLLTEAGYDVTGMTMCLGVEGGGDGIRCCGREAVDDARRVCDRLKINHYVMDFKKPMEELIIDKFTREYRQGRTPNPCIDCNRYLKFGILLARARELGFRHLATGHYAKIDLRGNRHCLLRPKDRTKDQTYFLYPIRSGDLASILFPLGDLIKTEVRDIARKANLPVAEKGESQDLCFAPQGYHRWFLQERGSGGEPGDIVDGKGNILGRHRGVSFYTLGQRSGLGISARAPLYVKQIDPGRNRIVVGAKRDLMARGLLSSDLNLFAGELPTEAEAKIRYRKRPARCRLFPEGDRLRVLFDEEQESITPGQAVVFYDEDEVLGGGVIEEVIHEHT